MREICSKKWGRTLFVTLFVTSWHIIVLPESSDSRVIKAASIISKQGFANIILLGDEDSVRKKAADEDADISRTTILNPLSSKRFDDHVMMYYDMRSNKKTGGIE